MEVRYRTRPKFLGEVFFRELNGYNLTKLRISDRTSFLQRRDFRKSLTKIIIILLINSCYCRSKNVTEINWSKLINFLPLFMFFCL